jgi:hypothetical protein
MLKSICGLHKYMLCLSNVKAKRKNKKKRRRGLPRVHGQRHSGKTFTKKTAVFFPECLVRGTRGRGFFFKKNSSPSVALGEEFFF